MKTYSAKPSDIKREQHVIDATDQTLGRLVTQVVNLLMGKHKTIYTRSMDTGDFVTVINADKVRVTGNKANQKMYYRHSGYPGGLRAVSYQEMLAQHPTRIIEHAVKGMLPQTKLGDAMFKKLKVYASKDNPPVKVKIEAQKAS